MDDDDEICLCFHVTRRKIVNWIRIEKPQRPPQIADCGGAGTGCGWCRPVLEKLFRQAQHGSVSAADNRLDSQESPAAETLSATDYAAQRQIYLAEKKARSPQISTSNDEQGT